MKELEKAFNELKQLAKDCHKKGKELDRLIDERWGFSYSDGDFDEIADTLEYGTGAMSFNRFCKIMDDAK